MALNRNEARRIAVLFHAANLRQFFRIQGSGHRLTVSLVGQESPHQKPPFQEPRCKSCRKMNAFRAYILLRKNWRKPCLRPLVAQLVTFAIPMVWSPEFIRVLRTFYNTRSSGSAEISGDSTRYCGSTDDFSRQARFVRMRKSRQFPQFGPAHMAGNLGATCNLRVL